MSAYREAYARVYELARCLKADEVLLAPPGMLPLELMRGKSLMRRVVSKTPCRIEILTLAELQRMHDDVACEISDDEDIPDLI